MNKKTDTSRALPVPASRLARLGQLSTMTAGVAGNMALNGLAQIGQGHRPSMRDLLLTPGNMARVAEQLAKMRGAAMKIGQLMSMDTGDVMPPELAQIMARLRDDAHFMPPPQLKRVLNAQWPKDWLREFKSFNVRPIAAASIGQVHRAVLRDDRDMAIKVQYPGVARSIDSDVANVGALIRMSGVLPRGFDLAPYLEDARKQLHEETDYTREAAEMAAFSELLAGDARFIVPQPYGDWSTDTILAMQFVEGLPIEQAAEAPQDTRDRIATCLIDLTLREIFDFGRMQTDPNFANYLYRPQSGQIVLLDFGASRQLSPDITKSYKGLIDAGRRSDRSGLEKIAGEIGFIADDTRADHRNRIVDMMCIAFSALSRDPIVDFRKMAAISREMQANGMALAESGFVPPPVPIDVLLIQRKLGGVFLLAARLEARVHVNTLFDKYLDQARS